PTPGGTENRACPPPPPSKKPGLPESLKLFKSYPAPRARVPGTTTSAAASLVFLTTRPTREHEPPQSPTPWGTEASARPPPPPSKKPGLPESLKLFKSYPAPRARVPGTTTSAAASLVFLTTRPTREHEPPQSPTPWGTEKRACPPPPPSKKPGLPESLKLLKSYPVPRARVPGTTTSAASSLVFLTTRRTREHEPPQSPTPRGTENRACPPPAPPQSKPSGRSGRLNPNQSPTPGTRDPDQPTSAPAAFQAASSTREPESQQKHHPPRGLETRAAHRPSNTAHRRSCPSIQANQVAFTETKAPPPGSETRARPPPSPPPPSWSKQPG
ncbi:PREDICTED: basic proline-rich protein-like, partial [Galeopterus variegatus]|uniref:Basic proline-rich protein-like n=1 Tax=Galeopterus variegatus TaxID=482537 RepID=A0ABM0Q297_GALVR